MRRRWQFWVDLFSQREVGTTLALFRISLGIVTLYSLLSVAGWGMVDALWTGSQYGDGGMRLLYGNWLVQYLGGTTPGVVWSLWVVALCSTVAFTTGAGGPIAGRLVTLLMLQSYNALVTINPLASGGYDALMSNAMWILVFAHPTATLSVYARWRSGAWRTDVQVLAWPRYILIFQILLMYSFTGFQKSAHVWTPGGGYTALYWVVQDLGWTRWAVVDYAAWTTPLLRIGTAVTWHWEQLSLLLMFWFYFRCTAHRPGRVRHWVLRRDWRLGWALVGMGLHVTILLLMNVGPFSWISMSYYILMWTPREWATAGGRLRDVTGGT